MKDLKCPLNPECKNEDREICSLCQVSLEEYYRTMEEAAKEIIIINFDGGYDR
jgi:hypothetical protein